MAERHFRFSTEIIRRLGEELNPSAEQGILELVKNAYDADATTCVVRLNGAGENTPGVEVVDDGVGMTPQEIVDSWLVLGRSQKRVRQKTLKFGRVPAGSKGLGRLAALRLGSRAVLRTRSERRPAVLHTLSIDWTQFDKQNLVEEFPIPIISKRARGAAGTTVAIYSLREPLSQAAAHRLARGLILLANPFDEEKGGFATRLESTEFESLRRLVERRYFDEADYHVEATLRSGVGSVRARDWKGRVLFSGDHSELAVGRDGRPYQTVDLRFELWVFLLNKQAFASKASSVSEVKVWLGTFGGVHVYQNGVRVAPYGDQGNDWLEMNLSRARSPEERPSTNTSLGRVMLDDAEGLLVQKTDRSGFIESAAFSEAREFCGDALRWLAKVRMRAASARRRRQAVAINHNVEKSREVLDQAVEAAPRRSRAAISKAVASYDRSRKRQIDKLTQELQLYRTLGTIGITAAVYAHETSGGPGKVISGNLKTLRRRLTLDVTRAAMRSRYEEPLLLMENAVRTLESYSSAALSLVQATKRRLARVDFHQVIRDVTKVLGPFLAARGIRVDLVLGDGQPYLRATEAAVEAVLVNLLNNSATALQETSGARKIELRTTWTSEAVDLQLADNGPGIRGIGLNDIWLAGETTTQGGTGLGLAIVRDTVADLGGAVSAVSRGEILGGAEFHVILPIVGVG